MKLGEMIAEEKKVRCSGCGMVIIVTPHPSNPLEVMTSIPKRHEKPKGMSDTQKKKVLVGALLALGLLVGGLFGGAQPPRPPGAVPGRPTAQPQPQVQQPPIQPSPQFNQGTLLPPGP